MRASHQTMRRLIVAILATGPWVAGATAWGQESWDVFYMGQAKIGWAHTFVEKVKDRGRQYLRVRIDLEQHLKRGNDVSVTKLMYGTIETPEGRVLRLDTLTSLGEGTRIQTHGDVIDGKMDLIMEGAGQRQVLTIPWGPEVRGPYAPEQSMARKPMVEGETRSLRMFMPDLNKICDLTLKADKVRSTLLGDGSSRPLLKVDMEITVDGKRRTEFDATHWVDSQGQVLRADQDLMGGLVTFRTTKEAALSPAGPIKFDMIRQSVVKVRDFTDPDRTRRVTYRLTLKAGDPAKVFPVDPRQSLDAAAEIKPNSAVMVVQSQGPSDGVAGSTGVAAEYLEPNALITSDDEEIQRQARRITQGLDDPWAKIERINHWVFTKIQDKNFAVAFAPASEVVRNLSGDCTEHSVLAAAMLRAVGVPSRVVTGLVYFRDARIKTKGFGFHMWDEVYVNQRWVAIDPSFDQTTVDAVHIKLSESSLKGVAPFETFVPILSVIGKLEIEPLEVR